MADKFDVKCFRCGGDHFAGLACPSEEIQARVTTLETYAQQLADQQKDLARRQAQILAGAKKVKHGLIR